MNQRHLRPLLAARFVRGATVALAALAWTAVLLQLYLSLTLAVAGGKSVAAGLVIYLGFFTILTNLLVGVTLTWPLLAPGSAPGRFFARPSVLSGVTVSILLVGLGYHFLLRQVWNPQGLQLLADVLLHYAVPVLFAAYWWLAVPKASLRSTDALRWCLYPAAYLGYALIRGALLGSYPYPFIDRSVLGWGKTLLNAGGLLLACLVLGWLLIAVGRANRRDTRK